jgi:hypothetical protein
MSWLERYGTGKLRGPLGLAVDSLVTLCFVSVTFFVFVVLQYRLVRAPMFFWTLVVVLTVLSFLSALIEAAHVNLSRDLQFKKTTEKAYLELYEKITKAYQDLAKPELASARHRQLQRQVLEWENSLRQGVLMDSTQARVEGAKYAGSMLILNTFFNAALVAYIPSALISGAGPELMGVTVPCIPTITIGPAPEILSIHCVAQHYDLTNRDAFVFFASAFPILFLGTLVPKSLGAMYPGFFVKSLFPITRRTVTICGWLSGGADALVSVVDALVVRQKRSKP